MYRLRVLLSRLIELVRRGDREQRLDDEIRTHLDLLVDEYMVRGMSPDEARRAARREFGNVDRVRALHQEQRGVPLVDSVAQDLRFAFRLLRHNPGFALTVVLVLGLGIGVNNMLFTILNAHTLRGLPIAHADRVVYITTADDRSPDRGVSLADFRDWRDAARSFAGLAAYTSAPAVLSNDARAAERFTATFVSAGAFRLIGTTPVLGRDFTDKDDARGAPPVVMIGTAAWESRYGRDPGIAGRSVMVNGVWTEIIGVIPARSGFPTTADIWMPLAQAPGLFAQSRDVTTLRVLGRVRDGVPVSEAAAEIETAIAASASVDGAAGNKTRALIVPINQQFFGSVNQPAWLAFMAAGVIVVLISCANAANLMLARSLQRAREIAIRASLGASPGRLVRQLLLEGAVLASLGGALGLGAAVAGVRLFRSAIPANALPYWMDYSPDWRVLAALVGVSAATVFLFALLPAVHASRTDVDFVLKSGGRTGMRPGSGRWTTAFLAAEFGLAVVLLSHLVVNVRTMAPPIPTDRLLDSSAVLTASIALPPAAYPTPEHRRAFYSGLEDRLGAVPAVERAALAGALPLSGGDQRQIVIDGRPEDASADRVWTVAVGPGYFETLGIGVVRGRDFTAEDGSPGRESVIVSERLVEQYFADTDPLGRRIQLRDGRDAASREAAWATIVGVVPGIRQRPAPQPDPLVYTPFNAAAPPSSQLVVRSSLETGALTTLIRSEMGEIDGNLPLYRVATMAQVYRDAQWNGRLSSRLFLTLTLIAGALSTAGLYAATAYAVSRRSQEFGVRRALGAGRWPIVRLVARQVAFQLGIGLAAGVALTKVWTWTFPAGRDGITPTDPATLIAVAVVLAGAGVLACAIPVRRALRIDPLAAIRNE